MEVLEKSITPMCAIDAHAQVLNRYPGLRVGSSTVASLLSNLAKQGMAAKVPGASSTSGRVEYYMPMAHVAGAKSLQTTRKSEAATAEPSTSQNVSEAQYAGSIVSCILNAMACVVDSQDRRAINGLAIKAILHFVSMEPWREDGFFWVRCQRHGAILTSLSVIIRSEANQATIHRLKQMTLTQYSEITNPVIVRDGAYKSDAKKIKDSYFMATAIIWYLITQLSAVDQSKDAVQQFLAYAGENYVGPTNSANVVDTYTDIQARLVARQERSKRDEAAAAMTQASAEAQDSYEGKKVDNPAKPADALHCQILDAVWAQDGGLHITMLIPRDIAKKLLQQSE
jgi:hypothetical protein